MPYIKKRKKKKFKTWQRDITEKELQKRHKTFQKGGAKEIEGESFQQHVVPGQPGHSRDVQELENEKFQRYMKKKKRKLPKKYIEPYA